MPFDPIPRETATERRARLIVALRQEMPPDFVWDFRQWLGKHECGSVGCACGLAVHLRISKNTQIDAMATSLGMTVADAKRIFWPNPWHCVWTYGVVGYDHISPAMVANALERIVP